MLMILAAVDTNAVMNAAAKSISDNREALISLARQYGPNILVAVMFLVGGLIAGRWLGALTMRQLSKRDMEPPIRMLLVRFVKLLVLILTLLLIADNLQIKLLPLIAGLGIAGVGVGLAMQGVLSNLVAGLTIIFVKSFRVGEYIEIAGVHGQVETIELFSTRLVHADRSRIVVPNRKIVGEIIHNYGVIRQADLSVGVAYGTDLNRALEIIADVLRSNKRVLKEPAPIVGTAQLGDSSITLAIKPWVALDDYVPVQAEVNKAVVEKLREHGIEIPFPQREIRLLPGSQIRTAA